MGIERVKYFNLLTKVNCWLITQEKYNLCKVALLCYYSSVYNIPCSQMQSDWNMGEENT